MTVTIFTFPGTGGVDPTLYEISEFMNPDTTLSWAQRRAGGGFPANVATRLLQEQGESVWRWVPVDYEPGFRIRRPLRPSEPYDIPLKNGSIGRALAMLGGKLAANPGKIVLCGLSQGAWVCDLAFEEFRNANGLFHSRYSDLVSVVTFGSPRRPAGWSTPLPGAVHGSGAGVANFTHELSFGSVPGHVADPPSYMWSFSNLNDAASDSTQTDPQKTALTRIAEFLWDGNVLGTGLLLQLPGLLADLGLSAAWNVIKPDSTSPYALSKWLPFVAGAAGSDPRINNPHACYNSYAYTGVTGSQYDSGGTSVTVTSGNRAKTAVDLAVDYLKTIGATYADASTAISTTPRLGYTWWQTPPDAA